MGAKPKPRRAAKRKRHWYFVAKRLRMWGGALRLNGIPVRLEGVESIGFLEVFPTIEALRREYPGDDYVTIEEV